jgi:TMEM175 potassium channel family protein
MRTSRLEAFSDGVLAIIITIMVLELHAPEGDDWHALSESATSFVTYALSFVYVGIYWNNHHHMFQVIESISGGVLWANLHLLFWLSLFPFTTGWMDESGFSQIPTIVYGLNLLLAAVAFSLVQLAVLRGRDGSRLAAVLGRDLKGKASPAMYLFGIALTFVAPWLGVTMFVFAALVWLVPDRRVERFLRAEAESSESSA